VPGSDSDRVRALADRYWDQFLALDPLWATQVGDERFDDQLPDRSPAGLAKREEVHRAALEELRQVPTDGLDEEGRLTRDMVQTLATNELAAIEHRFDRFEAADQMLGPGTMLGQLGSLQVADTSDRLERYLRRLEGLPEFLVASADLLKDAGDAAQTSPRLIVDRTIAQIERLLQIPPAESPALLPIPEARSDDRTRVEDILRDRVYPSYRSYLGALRDYRTVARDSLGLGALDRGEGMYAAKILAWTTLPLGAEEIHKRGADELARIQEERADLAARLGAPDAETAIARVSEKGGNAFRSREDIIRLAEEQVGRGWEAAPRFFGHLPKENCRVKPIDLAREQDVGEHYLPATADGSRPGTYFVNTRDPAQRHRHTLATTSYHEASPGHHFQSAIEQEAVDRAAIRRFAAELVSSAFVEGWGLYSERLADEMQLYADGYERLGMLDMQAFRAARLVVDTGIHTLGWSRKKAVDTMASTGAARATCEMEVDRYIAMPGQALSYTLGQLSITGARREASDRLGEAFSLRAFHDRVLSLGSVPLSTFEEEMRSFEG
jgi:uncharacterized protein (DUF885 family)